MKIQQLTWVRLAGITLLVGLAVMLTLPGKANAALTVGDIVIDFGHNEDRVTIRGTLHAATNSTSTSDFTVRVIITDNRTGAQHDSGDVVPTVVR